MQSLKNLGIISIGSESFGIIPIALQFSSCSLLNFLGASPYVKSIVTNTSSFLPSNVYLELSKKSFSSIRLVD